MERRKFTREFKLEAVKLITERGVKVAQASQDLGVHPTQLRQRVKDFEGGPEQAFPGHGQMKPEQAEIARLKREVIKLKAERDILKKPRSTSRRRACEVRFHREAPGNLAGRMVVRGARGLAWWLLGVGTSFVHPPKAGAGDLAVNVTRSACSKQDAIWRDVRSAAVINA
jgi:transposase